MATIEQLLPYALPPLLGAFIGYVTNYIAIRMLFRPLRPWRILGVRLPLTPGIIPAKRHELAEKMGDLVGSHLLTSEDVARTLEKDSFRRELKGTVADKLDAFLNRDLGPAVALVPESYRRRFADLVEVGRWRGVKGIFCYLESEPFEARLRSFVERQTETFLARDLESYLTPERHQALIRHLDDRLQAFLHSEGLTRAVAALAEGKTEQLLSSRKSLRELLPEDLVDLLLGRLEQEVPPLLEKFGGLLHDPHFREQLIRRGREAIDRFLDSLEGFSGLLSGFINLDKIYARIPGFLDQASEEIAAWLREERTQRQVAALLRSRIEDLLDRPLCSFTEKVSFEKIAGIKAFARAQALRLLADRRTAELLRTAAERGIDRLKDRPFGELLDRVLAPAGMGRVVDLLTAEGLRLIRSPEVRRAVENLAAEKTEEWLFRRPLGRLSARLPADVRIELEEGLCQQLEEVLKKEVPPLVESLNVRRIVEEKVNSLDILRVEGLLMAIMQEQFKYINLFGALLGFLIGLVNLAALRLM